MSLAPNRVGVRGFDRWAKTYDQDRRQPWFARCQARALATVELNRGDVLLDVGCGTGGAVLQAARGGIRRACGLDLSPAMVERAKRRAQNFPNVEFGVGDAEAIPYGDGEFTAIICTNSFHHYGNPRRALGEMHRVLRPGGRALILDPDRAGCLWVWGWDWILRVLERGHVRYYTLAEIAGLIRQAGFADITVMASDHGHLGHGKVAWATVIVRGDKR